MLTDLREEETEREQWDTDPFMSSPYSLWPNISSAVPQNAVLNLPDVEKREIRGFSGNCDFLRYSALCWTTCKTQVQFRLMLQNSEHLLRGVGSTIKDQVKGFLRSFFSFMSFLSEYIEYIFNPPFWSLIELLHCRMGGTEKLHNLIVPLPFFCLLIFFFSHILSWQLSLAGLFRIEWRCFYLSQSWEICLFVR